ncbi:GNAT family N-acetyltransferase [Kurthia sibirica]|uniref:GNAT family N-acetyltransferase n=1 Tax=Kurthia sibirica TaxID=202750 RepID=A0A2U3AKQ2_9BACL|nr:GNAT family N-acetyltransferase [Kurthia sibirica]PWI25093.1 GNAT family N-acetyltransferase [Kurthia sibirica]GEK34013.1 N-acetyltransferase [Kurthia sibirica]
MTTTVRIMTKDDISIVRKIAIESWHSAYENIIPIQVQDDFLAMAYSKDVLEKRVESTPFYVVETVEEVIGFANFSQPKANGALELSAIYILPSEQNSGAGTQLLEYGIKNLQPQKIYISVETDNESAINFYKAKKFMMIDEYDELFHTHVLKTTRMCLTL